MHFFQGHIIQFIGRDDAMHILTVIALLNTAMLCKWIFAKVEEVICKKRSQRCVRQGAYV